MKINLITSSKTKSVYLQKVLIISWMILTTSLLIWWFIFGNDLISQLKATGLSHQKHLIRQQTMLFQEGLFLFSLLMMGALALLYSVSNQKNQSDRLELFFSGLTHEVRTSLTVIRTQAEIMLEDDLFKSRGESLNRLIKKTVYMDLQLENALSLLTERSNRWLIEDININELIESLRVQWPELNIVYNKNACINVDRRSIELVLNNIIQNSIIHGKATKVDIKIDENYNFGKFKYKYLIYIISKLSIINKIFNIKLNKSWLSIKIADNGCGIDYSNFKNKDFDKPICFELLKSKSTRTGMGLNIIFQIIKRWGGDFKIYSRINEGFIVEFIVPGVIK